MWVLVFIYFYEGVPYVEKVNQHISMANCFHARDVLSAEVGDGWGTFKPSQQAICITLEGEPT
jgi:hypothetical protein